MSGSPAIYSFLPWLRQGMSTTITNQDGQNTINNPIRIETNVKLKIVTDISGQQEVTNKMSLYGPGDITSLEPSTIIRTEPINNSIDFEPNFLSFVEFSQPDFPWRYTPAAPSATKTLRPWLFLIVLQDDRTEFDKINTDIETPLPWITVYDVSKLPNPVQLWAWAHVQVLNKIEGEIQNVLASRPSHFTSRIICPRKLKPNKSYVAFLVPSFETGRLAGLGDTQNMETVDGLKSAWSTNITSSVDLPIYYSFKFKTGEAGDFESLVRKLKSQQMPSGVGIRDIDVSDPGLNLQSASPSGLIGLEGALKAPTTISTPWDDQGAADFKIALTEILNAPDDATTMNDGQEMPRVAPPIYGCWHARTSKVNPGTNPEGWITRLNLDPRNRAAAGLGALVVRKDQDKMMASAWKQVADIERINQALKQAQLAIEISTKHIEKIRLLPVEEIIKFTSPVHTKIIGSSKTVTQLFYDSIIPEAAISPTLRQIGRPRGPIRQRSIYTRKSKTMTENDKNLLYSSNLLSRINCGEITAAPKRIRPDKIAEMDSISDKLALAPDVRSETDGGGESAVRSVTNKNRDKGIVFKKFTSESIKALPSRRDFVLKTRWSDIGPEQPSPIEIPEGEDDEDAKEFRKAAAKLFQELIVSDDFQPESQMADIDQIHSTISTALEPSITIATNFKNRLKVNRSVNWDPQNPIEPIMVAPIFSQPMYEGLQSISQDYLLPGLEKIPSNTISLLLPNQKFIEAYMVGLNHEMSRELLWREFPTDKGGTYFRQFWDVRGCLQAMTNIIPEYMNDIQKIHKWNTSSTLGSHSPKQLATESDNDDYLVLLIRGDLMKRYPNSVLYAVRAVRDMNPDSIFTRKLITPEKEPDRIDPIFRGTLYPDIMFVGFDLTEQQARGNQDYPDGWYFIIQEQPTEPRFGLDAEDASKPFGEEIESWSNLSWNSIVESKEDLDNLVNIDINRNKPKATSDAEVEWGENSSNMAYIFLQKRMRIAVHAQDMLPTQNNEQ